MTQKEEDKALLGAVLVLAVGAYLIFSWWTG